MKHPYWLIFLAIQITGVAAAFEAVRFQFGFFLIIAWLFLLPGILPFSIPAVIEKLGDHAWFLWFAVGCAIVINLIVFAAIRFLYRRSQRTKLV